MGGTDIHSAYFGPYQTIGLIREILRGIDRSVLSTLGRTEDTAWADSLKDTAI